MKTPGLVWVINRCKLIRTDKMFVFEEAYSVGVGYCCSYYLHLFTLDFVLCTYVSLFFLPKQFNKYIHFPLSRRINRYFLDVAKWISFGL